MGAALAKGSLAIAAAGGVGGDGISGLFTWIFHAIFEPSSAVTVRVFFVSLDGSFVYSGGVTMTSLRTSAG